MGICFHKSQKQIKVDNNMIQENNKTKQTIPDKSEKTDSLKPDPLDNLELSGRFKNMDEWDGN